MNPALVARCAESLDRALQMRTPIDPLTEQEIGISIDDAYEISKAFCGFRIARGDQVVGKKIGVTSAAVQQMLGVHQPDFGFLLASMDVSREGSVSLSAHKLIQPRAEGEIGFRLARSLKGPGVTAADVLAATESVFPCFEIVDSRIKNWKIKIQDTIADNASCGVFVLGHPVALPTGVSLADVHMVIHQNGQKVAEGMGSAVQGHPAQAVAWLANTLGAYGIAFEAGEVILSGSLAPLLPAQPGDHFLMEISSLGRAEVRFTE
ncbi:MAG: hypothetical protein RLY30_1033 [Pseudomonadota bacterium]|jgi:2-oxopent-4-enoate/cis-2-oxohex-4-enoate hydratase